MKTLIGILSVAAVATLGDYVWFSMNLEHRVASGIAYGAIVLAAAGGVVGSMSGRLIAGLPLGAAAGVGGALVYYALAPVLGLSAMLAAWASLWMLLAGFDGWVLRRGSGRGERRSTASILGRGLAAGVLGGVAFYLALETIWGRPPAGGRNYWLQFGAWAFAWAPGLIALTIGSRPKSQA